ncbi:hypothetical protein OAS19_04720 [Altererythrobacter sp.]|nr:hypothetical protein [Altererythrobacter sp.]
MVRRPTQLGIASALTVLAWGHTVAAQASNDTKAEPNETIVVTGQRELEERAVRDTVADIAMRGRNQYEPIAQYQSPLCVAAKGLDPQSDEYVAERIRINARSTGLPTGEDGCETNALVIVVGNPAALIESLRKAQPHLFGLRANQKMKAALKRGQPALAWSAYRANGPRGGDLAAPGGIAGATGIAPVSQGAGESVKQTRSGGISRFKIAYSVEKVFTVVVFDIGQLIGVHLDQLADFATMRILADPQRKVQLGEGAGDTILSLFDAEPDQAPGQMTQIDRAFLRGLYALRPNDPANRLEKFVVAAYGDIVDQDCNANDCADTAPDGETP